MCVPAQHISARRKAVVPALETPVAGLGIKAGCGSSPHGAPDRPYSWLDVLLNGDRLYTATGWAPSHATG